MVRGAVLVLSLAGCDIVFRLDDLRTETSDGSVVRDVAADAAPLIDAPASCLHDMFTGSDIQGHWSVINELSAFEIDQADTLEITLPTSFNANAEGALQTYRKYNFTGAFAQVEVPVVTTSTTYNAENYFTVRIDNQNAYLIRVANGDIDFWTRRLGQLMDIGGRPYEAGAHRWWRIEHAVMDNTIRFSTSHDGQDWFEQGRSVASVPLTRIEVSLRAGNLAPGDPNPGRAVFDNFLLCPAVIAL